MTLLIATLTMVGTELVLYEKMEETTETNAATCVKDVDTNVLMERRASAPPVSCDFYINDSSSNTSETSNESVEADLELEIDRLNVVEQTTTAPLRPRRHVRFGPDETYLLPKRRAVRKNALWWTKQELDQLRTDFRTLATPDELEQISSYLQAYELSYTSVLDDPEYVHNVVTATTTTRPMEHLLHGLQLGYHGLERCSSFEMVRQVHRRSLVRHVVDTSRRLLESPTNPYRHEQIRAVATLSTQPMVEWAVCLGAAASVAARSSCTTHTHSSDGSPVAATIVDATTTPTPCISQPYQRIEV